VVQRSASLLLHTGSPYLAHPTGVTDFNPYLPGMALFGLPHALLGGTPLGDARLWFGLTFLLTMGFAAHCATERGVSRPRDGRPQTKPRALTPDGTVVPMLLAAFPAVALPLAVGGVDLPVIGLICLSLSLSARRGNPLAAGAAMGAAVALKWTAWPLLPVALALIAVTAGRRAALRAAGSALAVAAVAIIPAALANPHAFTEHVVLFPLGKAGSGSPATSPLPGYLLATYVPGGFALAVTALLASAIGVTASLWRHPPRTTVAAADRLALGLTLAMCLIPATRFGYLVYPLVLLTWFRLHRRASYDAPVIPRPPGSPRP
jgi:hypothetical protein